MQIRLLKKTVMNKWLTKGKFTIIFTGEKIIIKERLHNKSKIGLQLIKALITYTCMHQPIVYHNISKETCNFFC